MGSPFIVLSVPVTERQMLYRADIYNAMHYLYRDCDTHRRSVMYVMGIPQQEHTFLFRKDHPNLTGIMHTIRFLTLALTDYTVRPRNYQPLADLIGEPNHE